MSSGNFLRRSFTNVFKHPKMKDYLSSKHEWQEIVKLVQFWNKIQSGLKWFVNESIQCREWTIFPLSLKKCDIKWISYEWALSIKHQAVNNCHDLCVNLINSFHLSPVSNNKNIYIDSLIELYWSFSICFHNGQVDINSVQQMEMNEVSELNIPNWMTNEWVYILKNDSMEKCPAEPIVVIMSTISKKWLKNEFWLHVAQSLQIDKVNKWHQSKIFYKNH